MTARIVAIILNLNGHDVTCECIHSLLAANRSDLQIVVVDNGSTDRSVELIKRAFPEIILLPQDRNLGFAAGCNIGIRHAMSEGAEYVLLLNNDAFFAPDFVSQMLSVIQADRRIAAVCPKIFFAELPQTIWYAGADFSPWTGVTKHRGWKAMDRGQFDDPHDITLLTGCAMLVRSSAVRDIGLLDEQFWAYAEDLDWSLRFRKKGYRLVFAPKAHAWHHDGRTAVAALGAGSQSMRQFLSTRNMVFVARKHVTWLQVPGFAVGFSLNHVAFYTALRMWKRDFRALRAICKGLIEGFRTSLGSSTRQPVDPQNSFQLEGQGVCSTKTVSRSLKA
jgi:GT2 family glycosyltransferase